MMNGKVVGRVSALLLVLATSGCAINLKARDDGERAALLERFATGNVTLDCGFSCSGRFIFNQFEIRTLYLAGDWENLAIAVMKTEWRQDLTYFYLGAAARELGYNVAASRYLRIAGALATSAQANDRCSSIRNLCGPIRLPADIYPRLQAATLAIQAADRAAVSQQRTYSNAVPGATGPAYRPLPVPAAPLPAPTSPAVPYTPAPAPLPVATTPPDNPVWVDPPPLKK